MNMDKILTTFLGGIVGIAILTTILARSNTARVLDAFGNAGANLVGAALGRGVEFR